MTNCPGAAETASAPAGSSASVQVSAVSRSRRRTTKGSGANGPCACSASAAVAIDVEKSEPRPLQALDQHLREAAHQVVSESRVVVALLAQTRAVERGRAYVRQ